jgi:disulfide oxidoreductase YuzD
MAKEGRDNESSRGSFFDSSQRWEEHETGCLLCEKKITDKEFPNIISKALERKYCNNLNNYFYLKDINKLVNKER